MNPPPGGEAALQSGSDNIKTTKNFRRVVRCSASAAGLTIHIYRVL